jgi:transposase
VLVRFFIKIFFGEGLKLKMQTVDIGAVKKEDIKQMMRDIMGGRLTQEKLHIKIGNNYTLLSKSEVYKLLEHKNSKL